MLCVIDVLTRVLRNPSIRHQQSGVSRKWTLVYRSPVGLLIGLALATATPALLLGQSAKVDKPPVAFVHIGSPEQRMRYLAAAQIWADPGDLTPAALRAGPPLEDGSGVERALDGTPFPCTYAKPGKTMGGNTPKFLCATAAGKTIRLKYTPKGKSGNREVFAAVAASRLLWALGFKSDPIYPIEINCKGCPEDPMSGEGSKAQRSYLAIYQPEFTEVVMVEDKEDEGWRWGELDKAIDSLPAGEVRSRQRQHFDALMLAGVLLQHGDRKPEQQRLACGGTLKLEAGEIREGKHDERVFFERPGATACDAPMVTVQDVGATFGGAGKTTSGSSAKMNLESWTDKEVFQPASKDEPGCRGRLTVSMASGDGSLGNPRIGEAGRVFLLERLKRLTDEHLRAIFSAARVEQMTDDHAGIEAWVGAFKQKVRQIEERTCAPS
jgi:hypothetical protein